MSARSGPIIIIEDDPDDQEVVKDACNDLQIPNKLKFFSSATQALNYLLSTKEQPFIIISDVNLPGMDGKELRLKINNNDYLRKKSIPFVFFTTSGNKETVQSAYEMMVQGYFVKPDNYVQTKNLLKMIYDYWAVCLHPNC